ncbi:TlpA family protein disulfide reductase [Leeuwenhoekiella polynyae]|uniref:Thiol-disulfide isomerase/thioredoxin n=1 Tax=Leeuwenhoekiella polynyae TaxID=1550906 RepID=A0A4Q0P1E3_9FLAO|nr:TlpA disulfide reductase family protein [Leeuwenhoekiella polynyae]RXG20227.1 thiol-disulfide isomerase/thioredoxin [Leeuwenhoekiella polynyae]
MKISIHSLTFFVFLFVSNFCKAQENVRVIDNPDYEVTTSGITYIQRIESSPEETRVTMHSKFIPGWWINFTKDTYLRDAATDKKYMIKKVIDAEFDEKLRTPDSGEQFTELIFEPLPASTQTIDYVDASNTIFGVSLTQSSSETTKEVPSDVMNWIQDEVAQSDPALKRFDSDNFFHRKMGRIVGYMKGYDPRLGFETGMIYIGNELTREEYPTVVEIAPDGRFEAEIPLVQPLETYLVINEKGFTFYLEPGTTLGLILDWKEFLLADRYRDRRYEFESIEYHGPLAKMNRELNAFSPLRPDYREEFQKWVGTLAPLDFQSKILNLYTQNEARLNTFLSENSISKKAEDFHRAHIKLIASTDMFNFVDRRDYLKKKDTTHAILKLEVPDSYYESMQTLLPVNEPAALATNQYSTLINRLEYTNVFTKVEHDSQLSIFREPERTILEYFEEEGIALEEKYNFFLKPNDKKSKLDSLERIKLAKEFNEKYKTESQAYFKKYVEATPEDKAQVVLDKWKQKDSLLVHFFGVDKDLASDIIKVRSLKFFFDFWGKETSELVWASLKENIGNPFLKAEGQRIYEQTYPQVSDNEMIVDADIPTAETFKENTLILPEGKGTAAFRNITDPFKGKILFIDFWATWCGPCIGTIERMKETRRKYKDNPDFEFIFITDESSKSPKYEDFIKEQELEHVYRVDQSTYQRFRDLFSFNGIPQYIVLDKAGNVVDADFAMHSFDFKLPKILKKYK